MRESIFLHWLQWGQNVRLGFWLDYSFIFEAFGEVVTLLHCYLNQPLNTTGQVGVRVRRAPLFLLSCQWSVSVCLFFLETMKLTFFLLGSNTAREEIIATPCCVCGSAGRKKQWSMWCRFKRQDYDSPYGCCLHDIQAWVIYKNLTRVSSLKLFFSHIS